MMLEQARNPALSATLAMLESAVVPFPWTVGMYEAVFASDSAGVWCATHQGSIAVVLVLERVLDELTIQNLFVAQEFQRRGLARQCLHQLLQQSKAASDWRVLLEVRAGNQAAISLYRQAGFGVSGLRKAYYRALEGREDAILMEYVHD